MLKRCRRLRDGNMRKEPRWKERVVSSQNSVWYWISRQSTQKRSGSSPVPSPPARPPAPPAPGSAARSGGHCSQRKPPRISGEQRDPDLHTSRGHCAYFSRRMSISQFSPENTVHNTGQTLETRSSAETLWVRPPPITWFGEQSLENITPCGEWTT